MAIDLVDYERKAREAVQAFFRTAHDLWTAYSEGAFGKQPRPFVGWLMLVENAPESRSPVKDNSPHFPVFEEFKGASTVSAPSTARWPSKATP